jgi:MFS family permease
VGTFSAYRRVFANPRLARLLAGEFISSIGDWLYLVALLIVVYEVSHDPLALGLVGAGRIVPFLVLAVPAGIAADRFDRRMILVVTDVVRGVLQLVLAGLVLVSAPTLSIVVVAILAACASAFFGPAIGSYLPTLVEDEADLGPANSVWATLDDLAFFVGPAVAGILIASGGLALAFLLNAISFGVVTVILLGLPARTAPSADDAADEAPEEGQPAGWRSIASRIPGVVVLDGATSFVGAALGVLTVVVAYESLSAGEEVTGYLNAATGVGGLVAGVLAGWLVLRRLDVPIVGAAVVAAAMLAVLAATGSVAVALVAIAAASGALLILDVTSSTVLQRAVPDAERGRAMGVLQVSSSLAMILGAFVGPLLADAFGVGVALVGSALVAAALCIASIPLLAAAGGLRPPAVSDRRVALLRRSPFSTLPPGRLEAAASALAPVTVAAGDVVIRQGDDADRFYLVDAGRFRVTQRATDGAERELRTMGEGEGFGEIGLLTAAARTATVTAETDGTLFALDRDTFLDLVRAGPGLSSRLLDLHRGAAAAASRS